MQKPDGPTTPGAKSLSKSYQLLLSNLYSQNYPYQLYRNCEFLVIIFLFAFIVRLMFVVLFTGLSSLSGVLYIMRKTACFGLWGISLPRRFLGVWFLYPPMLILTPMSSEGKPRFVVHAERLAFLVTSGVSTSPTVLCTLLGVKCHFGTTVLYSLNVWSIWSGPDKILALPVVYIHQYNVQLLMVILFLYVLCFIVRVYTIWIDHVMI